MPRLPSPSSAFAALATAVLALLVALVAPAVSAAPLPLAIDPAQSSVEVVVRATVDSFTGKLDAYVADISVEPASHQIVSAAFAFKFADVHTGKADRDQAMLDWEEVATHPDANFQLLRLVPSPAGSLLATGRLTLHGVTRELTFPVSVTHEGERYGIDGAVTLDTRLFGLPLIRKFMVLKVDPEVLVRFHLQGSLANP